MERMRRGALKAKEKLRLNNLKILSFDANDHQRVRESKKIVDSFCLALGLKDLLAEDIIMDTLHQAHMASDEHYNISTAAAWNTTFQFPPEAIEEDRALWEHCSRDFTLLCRTKQDRLASNRLSVLRVKTTFGEFGEKIPGMHLRDFQLLLDFAANGITPILGDDFTPESVNIPPLRARYEKVEHTVNSLLYEQCKNGTMVLMDTKQAQQVEGAHFSPQHQADSKGKPEGRVIGDLSGQHDPAYTPLNGTAASKDALRQKIADTWGEIKHPTISQLVLMVLQAADTHGWDKLVLWKKDLKGAFNLLNYNPAYCRLFAFPLSNDITVFHLAGLFGWIGMPHAFQVLTRSLQALCQFIILGFCAWYVDDLMAVSSIASYIADSSSVDRAVELLLGDGSIARKKSQCARALEFLGWIIDLDAKTVTLCDRNLHKFIHALFCFDTQTKISIAHIQRIASLASRTSMLSRHMRPYTHELHIITACYSNPHVRISLTLQAQSDILMWRSFVLLLVARPPLLSRPLESFRPQPPSYCFKYDASLYRIAVGVYSVASEELLTFAAVDLPFQVTNEAKRQNTMEFLAIVFGLLLCWRLKLEHFHYNLHGDSMSSLAWAQNNRVNSSLARRGNIIFTTLSIHLDANVAITTHIPGVLNVLYDRLSRNIASNDLDIDSSKEYAANKQANLRDHLFKEALTLASNSIAASTRRAYASTWKKWTVFMQTCHHNPTADQINCKHSNSRELLQLLLMFVAYCVNVLQTSPTSIPGILSGLKNALNMKFVTLDAFDHSLLTAMKSAVSRIPYNPRVRLPCTYTMVLHIIDLNTRSGVIMDQLMIAVAVAMAYYLCLRASEYASRTAVPDPNSHQFDSKSIEFKLTNSSQLIPSYAIQSIPWTSVEVVRFTIQHAKNIKNGYGVPIWFSTADDNDDAVAFLRLVFLWSSTSIRLPSDPFLSYRKPDGSLHCLLYRTVHKAIEDCALDFGFNPKWFKPHSLRMSAPTVLRAAGGDDGEILTFGRWKQVPTSLVYQGTSTKNNNRWLRAVTNTNLFTTTDIDLTRLLPARKGQNQQPTVRRF